MHPNLTKGNKLDLEVDFSTSTGRVAPFSRTSMLEERLLNDLVWSKIPFEFNPKWGILYTPNPLAMKWWSAPVSKPFKTLCSGDSPGCFGWKNALLQAEFGAQELCPFKVSSTPWCRSLMWIGGFHMALSGNRCQIFSFRYQRVHILVRNMVQLSLNLRVTYWLRRGPFCQAFSYRFLCGAIGGA